MIRPKPIKRKAIEPGENRGKGNVYSRLTSLVIIRSVTLFCFCLTAASARPVASQDASKILSRLPDKAGIYVWTDDLPELLKQIELWSWPASKIGDRDGEPDPTDLSRLERLQIFRKVWQRLTEDRLFPGEAVVLLGFNKGAKSDQRLRAGVRSELTSIAVLARTDANEQQIEAFGSEVWRLFDPHHDRKGKAARSPESIDDGIPGVWRLSEGWFCWSDREEQVEELIGHITKDVRTLKSIYDNRSFQTAHHKLGNPLNSTHHVSAFASSTSIPWLLAFFEDLPILSEVLSDAGKGERFFHEMRGLALRAYFNDPEIEANLDGLFALDAFLLVTQPRHGFFAAIGNQESDSVDFGVPLLPLPVQTLTLFSFSDEGLFNAIAEMSRKEPEQVQDVSTFNLFQRFQQVVISNYWPTNSGSQLATSGYRLFDPSISDFAAEFDMEMIPRNKTEGYLRELHQQDVRFLATSRQEIERQISRYQSQLDGIRTELKDVHKDDSLAEDARSRRIEQLERHEFIIQQAMNDRLYERKHPRPLMVLAKRWLLSWYAEDDLEEIDLGDFKLYQDQHPQLLELQHDVESLGKVLGVQPKVHGVFSIWSNPAEQFGLGQRSSDVETRSDESGERDSKTPACDPILAAAQEFALQQLEKFFLTVCNDEDGFRISGALTHVPAKEPTN